MSNRDDQSEKITSAIAGPDARGRAALLLVESLLHELIANATITLEQAVSVVGAAIEVDRLLEADRPGRASANPRSSDLLRAIASSLRIDLPH